MLEGIAKKESILYVRVTNSNKKFIDKFAKKLKLSNSILVNEIITEFRKHADNANDSNKKPVL